MTLEAELEETIAWCRSAVGDPVAGGLRSVQ